MYADTPESKTRKVKNIAAELDLSPAEAEMVYRNLKSAIDRLDGPYATKPAAREFFDKYPWLDTVAWKTCNEDSIVVWVNGFTWAELNAKPHLVNWFAMSGPVWLDVLPLIAELDRPRWREAQPEIVLTAWRTGTLEIGKGVRW